MSHPLAYPDRPPDSLPLDLGSLPPLPPKWSAPAADAPLAGIWKKLGAVEVRCTSSSCGNDLHCFRLTKKLVSSHGPGTCRECKQALVSMKRVNARSLKDVDYSFAALQREYIRHYFWHVPFGDKAMNYALRAGRVALEERVPNRLRRRIGGASPAWDGRQTPMKPDRADAIDFAMHAVAACCRTCANYWHGLPLDRALSEEEIQYLSELVRRYLRARLPDLDDRPTKVPRRGLSAPVHEMVSRSTHEEGWATHDKTLRKAS